MAFIRVSNSLLTIAASITLILMMLHVVAHALGRFLFNSPIYGTNEWTEYWYLPLIALLGLPAAHIQREHVTATLVTERMNKNNAMVFRIFGYSVGSVLSILWGWFGLQEALKHQSLGSTAGVSSVLSWPVYFMVPIMFLLLASLYFVSIIVAARTGVPDPDLLSDVAWGSKGVVKRPAKADEVSYT